MFQKLGKNSFYKQKTSSNMFTLDEITFYMSKYNSTGRKHVSIVGKHSSYGKKNMFSLAENMFPLPGKIVITHEIMFWLVVI